jgi:hypothetical protein
MRAPVSSQGVGGLIPQIARGCNRSPPHAEIFEKTLNPPTLFSRETMTKRKTPTEVDLACKYCGKSFKAPFKNRGRNLGFCCSECREAAAAARASKYKSERRYERTKICSVCGSAFMTLTARVRSCGGACFRELKIRAAIARRKRYALGDLFEVSMTVCSDKPPTTPGEGVR